MKDIERGAYASTTEQIRVMQLSFVFKAAANGDEALRQRYLALEMANQDVNDYPENENFKEFRDSMQVCVDEYHLLGWSIKHRRSFSEISELETQAA